ncbi:hypothetical protein Hanom_Chr14g01315981 [Helianthus anomalus]
MALAFVRMSDSAYQVNTIARLAQWRIDSFGASSYRKSDPFMIGNCLSSLLCTGCRNKVLNYLQNSDLEGVR